MLEVIAVIILLLIGRAQASVASVFPVTLLTLTATSAKAITIILAVADIALAVYIAYLISAIIKVKKHVPLEFEEESDEEIQAETVIEKDNGIGELEIFTENTEQNFEPESEAVGSVGVEEEPETVVEASLIITEEKERYTGKKRAQINIDTISRSFNAGERITLNKLKEKKLLPANVGYVKVLARGTLDKPFTVVAQKYSAAAVKKITAAGGEAIVCEASPERLKRKNKRGASI